MTQAVRTFLTFQGGVATAALDLYRAGARVTLVHFASALDRNVKPWVMPDIVNRIAEG